MKILSTIILFLTFTTLYADVPQLTDDLIETYPSAYHRVWYYYDQIKGKEYFTTRFAAPRKSIKATDVDKIKAAYLSAWANTDFSTASGTQFRAPDSISMTIKDGSFVTLDLGKSNVSLDWGRETKTKGRWTKPDFTPIIRTFSTISKGHRSNVAKVSYTGFMKGLLFVFHRGEGRGFTNGERTTVYNISLQDFNKLRQTILDFIGKPTPVTVFDYSYHTMVKSECSPDFYAIRYDPATKVLCYLHATVEDEICIPNDWHIINRVQ